VVMTRTFSKVYRFGGAAHRLGLLSGRDRRCAQSHPRTVQCFRFPPKHAGAAALKDREHVQRSVEPMTLARLVDGRYPRHRPQGSTTVSPISSSSIFRETKGNQPWMPTAFYANTD